MNAIASINFRKLEQSVPWCDRCTLRNGCGFEDFSPEELAFMVDFKIGHGRAWVGEVILEEAPQKPRCYTLFSGWAVRYRLLPGGQRHVVGILLPGDMIGLQSALCGASDEVVEAVTDVTFCILDDTRALPHERPRKPPRQDAGLGELAACQSTGGCRSVQRPGKPGASDLRFARPPRAAANDAGILVQAASEPEAGCRGPWSNPGPSSSGPSRSSQG